MGGEGDGGNDPSVERSMINPDGTLGAFTVVGSVAVNGRFGAFSIVSGRSLYIIGGSTITAMSTVERASISDDNSLGQFGVVSDMLPDARQNYAFDTIGQYVYIFGGISGTDQTQMKSIVRAIINPDGSLGPFALSSDSLKAARSWGIARAIGNNVYLIGGIGANLSLLKSVAQAVLQ
jgi:N-acetylneuraminic acid mutarotase